MTTLAENRTIERPSERVTLERLASGAVGGAGWLEAVRSAAAERARELGMPERAHERWRTTNPSGILEPAYRLAGGEAADAEVPALPGPGLEVDASARLVFVDGAYAAGASDPSGLPEGVELTRLEELSDREAEAIRPVLDRDVAAARDGLEALSAGLAGCGFVIRVREGVTVEKPVLVSFIHTAGGGEPVLVSPRIVVVAKRGAEISVVEDHVGGEGAASAEGLTLGTTTLDAAANATIRHVLIERTGPAWQSVVTLRTRQDRDSHVRSHRLLLGGRTVRNNVVATLEGEQADAELNGLFLPRDRQHHDNEMRVEHMSPHCTSRQYYRGMPSDRARGFFTGRIYVHSEAQKTDAIQSSDNLLLSDRAEVNTRPQLEIYADDVRCTHGATTGQLDEDAMFYLRSRGLSERTSRLMLLHAFAGDIIHRVHNEGVRSWMRLVVEGRLDAALDGRDSPATPASSGEQR